MSNDITRTFSFEHKGETVQIHVSIQLSEEEIRRIVVPAMLEALHLEIRKRQNVRTAQNASATAL